MTSIFLAMLARSSMDDKAWMVGPDTLVQTEISPQVVDVYHEILNIYVSLECL